MRQISSLFLSGLEAALQGLSILTDACAGVCGVRVCGARVRARVRERRYGAARRPVASIPRGGEIDGWFVKTWSKTNHDEERG